MVGYCLTIVRVGGKASTPLEQTPPKRKKTGNSAAGIPAIISTAKHGISKMGILHSITSFSRVNKFDGFDCPGCAWPDPDDNRTIAEFCENGAKAIADEGTKKKADPNFWSKWTISELSEKSDQWLNSQGRITDPMILREGSEKYERILWPDAFSIIAGELSQLENSDKAIFYTSGRTSNEAAFLWQLLARSYGTNNLPDCSNMCHESSGVALSETIGIGKGTVKLEDFEKADLIIVVGQNPGTNHPRMLTALRDAKKSGASIISINPLKEKGMIRFKHPQNPLELFGYGTAIADDHVRVRINGDMALFRGFAKEIFSSKCEDSNFIHRYTTGSDDYRKIVENTGWEEISEISGIEISEIRRIGRIIGSAESVITCWAMGLTQHQNSVATIQEISNLHLLCGHIGNPGSGLCPVRGHSNVQGDRTVGINHKPSEEFLKSLETKFQISLNRSGGYDAVESVRMMSEAKNCVFLSMGGNFLSAMSDTKATADSLNSCSLTVQISTKPNRSHLITGKTALILPCLGRSEIDRSGTKNQFVTVENSMGVVHMSKGRARPASNNILSEPSIVSGIAESLEEIIGDSGIRWKWLSEDYNRIRDCIEETIPGFEDYNSRCVQDGGFYLPNPPRDSLEFNTESGKAKFVPNNLSSTIARDGLFIMMTIRSHDQYNTTIYGTEDRYRGISGGRRVVFMSKSDMDANGWKDLQVVNLTSHFKDKTIFSEGWYIFEYDIPPGNIATYFPESNILIPLESVAEYSNTPTSKSVVVSIST